MGTLIVLLIIAFVAYKLYMKKNGTRLKLEKEAKRGDKSALIALAYAYALGEDGCKQDLDKAASLMVQSQSTDDMVQLANGLRGYANADFPKKPELAFMLMDSANSLGDLKARYLLATMYQNGEGTPRNEKKAVELNLAAVRDPQMQNEDVRGGLERKLCDFYANGYEADGPGYTKGQGKNWNLAEHWAEESLKDFLRISDDKEAAQTCSVMINCYMLSEKKPLSEQELARWCYWACMSDMVKHVTENSGKLSDVDGFFNMNQGYPMEKAEAAQQEAVTLIERTTGVTVS